jgi:hypothetical protein
MAPGMSTEDAFTLIGQVSHSLERDDPYAAMSAALRSLDATGAYRLIAALLTSSPEATDHAEY